MNILSINNCGYSAIQATWWLTELWPLHTLHSGYEILFSSSQALVCYNIDDISWSKALSL